MNEHQESAGDKYNDLPILWLQSPTNRGSLLVHALGSMVSRQLQNPSIIEKPDTDAVIEPRVTAAKALVDI